MRAMADLIVDFPSRARCHSDSSRPKATKRKVRFSSEMTIQFYRGPSESEMDEVHYADEDYAAFKSANRRLIRSINKRYLALSAGMDGADAFRGCEVTGLENCLTPELIQKTMARKGGHRRAVLGEQDRQDAERCTDPERLAVVSRRSSWKSLKRAATIGTMQQFR